MLLAGLKFALGLAGLELFPLSPLLPSLLAGTIFLLGFLLAGVLADFKEAEKIPTEIASALRNIYDEGLYVKELKKDFDLEKLRIKVHRIVSSFLEEIGSGEGVAMSLKAVSELNESLIQMERLNVPAPYLARLKNEQGSLRRSILRASYIKENSFVGIAYVIAEAATAIVLIFLIFLRTSPPYEGIALLFAISFLLIYLLLLIRDMDNPFELKKGPASSYSADVKVTQLYDLKRSLELPEKT